MKIKNAKEFKESIQYYLVNSVFWTTDSNCKQCVNKCAEDAKNGNELAQKAMEARRFLEEEILRCFKSF
jgi:hypothetical protein